MDCYWMWQQGCAVDSEASAAWAQAILSAGAILAASLLQRSAQAAAERRDRQRQVRVLHAAVAAGKSNLDAIQRVHAKGAWGPSCRYYLSLAQEHLEVLRGVDIGLLDDKEGQLLAIGMRTTLVALIDRLTDLEEALGRGLRPPIETFDDLKKAFDEDWANTARLHMAHIADW